MEKYDATLQATRLKASTKKAIIEMAAIRKRKVHEFVRVVLEVLEEDYKKGSWKKLNY